MPIMYKQAGILGAVGAGLKGSIRLVKGGINITKDTLHKARGGIYKLQRSPSYIKYPVATGVVAAANVMNNGAQQAAQDYNDQMMYTGTYDKNLARERLGLSKGASALLNVRNSSTSNIPKDTSKPTSQSPLDGMDNFDYQEWVTTKGNNYPEREETESTQFDNPRKIAKALGFDVIDDNNMSKIARKNVNLDLLHRYRDYKKTGNRALGASVLAAGIGIPTSYLAFHDTTGQGVVNCTPSYTNY